MSEYQIKYDEELHVWVKMAAAKRRMTINEWIVQAIEEKLERDGD